MPSEIASKAQARKTKASNADVAASWDRAFAVVRSEHGPQKPLELRKKRAAEKNVQTEEARWVAQDRYDADSWFTVPELGVDPGSVNFVGFHHPVRYRGQPSVSEHVRGLVRAARTLTRSELPAASPEEIRLQAESARRVWAEHPTDWREAMHSKQKAAFLYETIIGDLHRSKWMRADDGLTHVASAADILVSWALEGAADALEKMRMISERNSKGGKGKTGKRNLLRAIIISEMRRLRTEDNLSLPQALQSLITSPPRGLVVTDCGDETYRFTHEDFDKDLVKPKSTLERWWTEAGPPPAR